LLWGLSITKVPLNSLGGSASVTSPYFINVTFDTEERPKALCIYGASLSIMGGLSSLIIQFFNHALGWRSVVLPVISLGIMTWG
jgi:hypothetical protein